MTYYRVRKETYDYFTWWTAVQNELVTEKERNTRFRYLSDFVFEKVEVSKKKIFFNFGCRFEAAG